METGEDRVAELDAAKKQGHHDLRPMVELQGDDEGEIAARPQQPGIETLDETISGPLPFVRHQPRLEQRCPAEDSLQTVAEADEGESQSGGATEKNARLAEDRAVGSPTNHRQKRKHQRQLENVRSFQRFDSCRLIRPALSAGSQLVSISRLPPHRAAGYLERLAAA